MLDYSRARKVEKSKVDLGDFLRDLKESFSDELARHQIECGLTLDEEIPALMLDADGLEKVMANLLVNAMEAYEDRPGTIELRTARVDEGAVAIEVADQAGGIPAEVLPRIFVPFFTTKGTRGSGLGLAMTKKIVEDMGGHIEVKTSDGGRDEFYDHAPGGSGFAPAGSGDAGNRESENQRSGGRGRARPLDRDLAGQAINP